MNTRGSYEFKSTYQKITYQNRGNHFDYIFFKTIAT